MEEIIKDFYGKVLGKIKTLPNGDKEVRDFYNHILGYYRRSQNITTDFYGKIIARGDCCTMLLK